MFLRFFFDSGLNINLSHYPKINKFHCSAEDENNIYALYNFKKYLTFIQKFATKCKNVKLLLRNLPYYL